MEENEAQEPSKIAPMVVYTGRSNERILSRRDISGQPGDSTLDVMKWAPGAGISWEHFVDWAGSPERAHEVLRLHRHEFELVGDLDPELASATEDEEFDVGGSVK